MGCSFLGAGGASPVDAGCWGGGTEEGLSLDNFLLFSAISESVPRRRNTRFFNGVEEDGRLSKSTAVAESFDVAEGVVVVVFLW